MTVTTYMQAIGRSNNTLTEVETNTKALREIPKPTDYGIGIGDFAESGGAYQMSQTFLMANSSTAAPIILSVTGVFRWALPGYECRVKKIQTSFAIGASAPAAGNINFQVTRNSQTPVTPQKTTNCGANVALPRGVYPSMLRSSFQQGVSASSPPPPNNFLSSAPVSYSANGDFLVSDLTGTAVQAAGGVAASLDKDYAAPGGVGDVTPIAAAFLGIPATAGLPFGAIGAQFPQQYAGNITLFEVKQGDMPLILFLDEALTFVSLASGSLNLADVTTKMSLTINYTAVPMALV